MLSLILQTKCHSGDSWTRDPRKPGLKGAPEGTPPVPHPCPLAPGLLIEGIRPPMSSQGSKIQSVSPASGTNAQGPLGLALPGLGVSLCVPLQPQLGRPALSLCYLRAVLITSYHSSPSCKAPPDHPTPGASSYLLTLSSPSITVHEFYLSLHGMGLIFYE